MRLDHYMKTSNNDIHLAVILYSLATIAVLIMILVTLLGKTISRDFNQIELINKRRLDKRDERKGNITS
jgi:hypothetical protein